MSSTTLAMLMERDWLHLQQMTTFIVSKNIPLSVDDIASSNRSWHHGPEATGPEVSGGERLTEVVARFTYT